MTAAQQDYVQKQQNLATQPSKDAAETAKKAQEELERSGEVLAKVEKDTLKKSYKAATNGLFDSAKALLKQNGTEELWKAQRQTQREFAKNQEVYQAFKKDHEQKKKNVQEMPAVAFDKSQKHAQQEMEKSSQNLAKAVEDNLQKQKNAMVTPSKAFANQAKETLDRMRRLWSRKEKQEQQELRKGKGVDKMVELRKFKGLKVARPAKEKN